MITEKITGLVIKTKNINENDKYVTILCQKYGKISFKAAGVRSFKSRYMTACQTFSYSEFNITQNGDFIKMNEAQTIETFYNLRFKSAAIALANYLCEIASVLCIGDPEEDGIILKLLLNCLYFVAVEKYSNEIVKAVFELRALSKSGFKPNLSCCEICNCESLEDLNKIMFFDILGGNLICEDCISKLNDNLEFGRKKLMRISHDILRALRFISNTKDEKIFAFNLSQDIVGELAEICEKYLLAQIAIDFDALKYYKNCLKNNLQNLNKN